MTPAENQKRIEDHKTTALHLETAARYQAEATKHLAAGNSAEAAKSTSHANEYFQSASDSYKEDLDHNTMSDYGVI